MIEVQNKKEGMVYEIESSNTDGTSTQNSTQKSMYNIMYILLTLIYD
jgi:hypothetical protein